MFSDIFHNPLIAQASGEPDYLPTILMTVGVFAIFYFLVIRPQQRRQKELKKQMEGLRKGDKFVTSGGLYATVVNIKERIVVARIANDVKVEVAKTAVAAVVEKAESSD